MRRIVVTGATGFIGRHIVAKLSKEKNIEIIVCGRNVAKLEQLIDDFGVTVLPFDIHEKCDNWFDKLGKPDALLHLAWGNLDNFHSIKHINTEFRYHYDFLCNLVQNGLKDLSVSGTCFEYGIVDGKTSEKASLAAVTNYGLAKAMLFQAMELFLKDFSVIFRWLRYFYMYGEGQVSKSLIGSLERAIEEGKEQFNMSAGDQLRDYLPVHKVAEYTILAVAQDKVLGAINICSGSPISIRELVEQRCEELRSNIKLNVGYYPYPSYEGMAFWGNSEKIQQILKNTGGA